MGKRFLITGGVRSGKSRYALHLSEERWPNAAKCFIATAQAFDEEMKTRITRHRQERDQTFVTVEEPIHLAQSIQNVRDRFDLILIDCLSLWVNNLFFHFKNSPSQIDHELKSLVETIDSQEIDFILVTNEIGLGLIPDNALARQYLERMGILNQEIARLCHEVIIMISGIPKVIKGEVNARLEI